MVVGGGAVVGGTVVPDVTVVVGGLVVATGSVVTGVVGDGAGVGWGSGTVVATLGAGVGDRVDGVAARTEVVGPVVVTGTVLEVVVDPSAG